MSSERSNEAGGTASEESVMSRSEGIPSTAPAPAAVPATPASTPKVVDAAVVATSGTVHPLLANIDVKGIQNDDWRVATEAQKWAAQKVSAKDVTGMLVACGLKEAEANKIVSFARTLQKAHPNATVFAELVAELRLAYFFAENYDLDSDSYDVEERRPTNRNLLWRLRRVLEVCEELSDARPEELRSAGFWVQDLFDREPRTLDGVVLRTRLDIARWLNGPYANATKAEEIKKLLPKMDLDLTADLDALESPSSQLNLAAWSVLKADRLFCVYEEHGNETLDPHARLTFLPANGSEPVILDFSFHQLFPKEAKSPFVGTRAELSAAVKQFKAQGKVLPLFDGNERNTACQNVTLEVIQSIQKALTAREPDAVYN
jgi:hypothetical protein